MKRILLMVTGFCFLGLGIVGIFLPLLPTTPFLLLAASLFLKSSTRLYGWLIGHRILGPYIKNYLIYRAVTKRSKIIGVSLVWLTIGLTGIFFVDSLVVRLLLATIAVAVTAHLLRMRTLTPEMIAEEKHPVSEGEQGR